MFLLAGALIFICWYYSRQTKTSNTSNTLTIDEARTIAQKSSCIKEGPSAGNATYNANTKTWWFDLAITKEGCSPACVVSEETKQAEINWRCTGLLQK